MNKPEKISDIISKYSTLKKPLMIYGSTRSNKEYRTNKQIEKQLGAVAIYSCAINSSSQFMSLIKKEKSAFVILSEFQRVWNNKEIIMWASKQKNLIVIATSKESDIPDHLNNFFTIKPIY